MLTSNSKKSGDTVFVKPIEHGEQVDTNSTRTREFESARIQMLEALRRKHTSCCIMFYLPNVKGPIVMTDKEEFVLGRRDKLGTYVPEVDLYPYHAHKLGVSRQHACVVYANDGFYIIDLDSTNGTFVNYRRLEDGDMYPLKAGDIIQLGQLTLRVG